MLDYFRKKNASSAMLTHFFLIALIYPLYSSGVGSPYSPDLIYSNIFVVLYISCMTLEGNVQWNKKSYLGYATVFFLICFNVCSFYVNKTYYGWYAGQINVTISFLFFLVWLYAKESAVCMNRNTIKLLLAFVAITNAIGIVPGLFRLGGVAVSVNGFSAVPFIDWKPGYTWIYTHKSDYAFALVLFLSFTVVYRNYFEKKWQFWASICVYIVGLYIANTRTTMFAALFIFAGFFMDYMLKKTNGFTWKYALWFFPILVVGIGLFFIVSRGRSISTLGDRLFIWNDAVAHILDNPLGIGPMCGLQSIPSELSFEVTNCHNVFLNILLQFSIPAGFFFILMLVLIAITALIKNKTFQTLGIWIALLIPMTMDWCLLLANVPMTLLIIYFMFFSPNRLEK